MMTGNRLGSDKRRRSHPEAKFRHQHEVKGILGQIGILMFDQPASTSYHTDKGRWMAGLSEVWRQDSLHKDCRLPSPLRGMKRDTESCGSLWDKALVVHIKSLPLYSRNWVHGGALSLISIGRILIWEVSSLWGKCYAAFSIWQLF